MGKHVQETIPKSRNRNKIILSTAMLSLSLMVTQTAYAAEGNNQIQAEAMERASETKKLNTSKNTPADILKDEAVSSAPEGDTAELRLNQAKLDSIAEAKAKAEAKAAVEAKAIADAKAAAEKAAAEKAAAEKAAAEKVAAEKAAAEKAAKAKAAAEKAAAEKAAAEKAAAEKAAAEKAAAEKVAAEQARIAAEQQVSWQMNAQGQANITPDKAPGIKAGTSKVGQAIANAALAQLGVKQDCTMLVTNSLKAVGINFHGWPAEYKSLGTIVSNPQPGDLIFYADAGASVNHIAVYLSHENGGTAVHGGMNGNNTEIGPANLGSGPVYIRVNG